MYHILSCRKFSRQTLRIVDTGETSIEAVMGAPMGECLICGPCSHVEVGQSSDYWTNHGGYETLEDATIAAWEIADDNKGTYTTLDLPERPKRELSEA